MGEDQHNTEKKALVSYSIRQGKGCFNAPCIFIEECTTLFDIAQQYIQENNAPDNSKKNSFCSGTVFLTKQQTAGQGQFDRKWLSEKEKSLLMVLMLSQPEQVQADKWSTESQARYNTLTKAMALAVLQSIQHCYTLIDKPLHNLSLVIKEPNDVLVEHKKIAGILIKPYLTWDCIGIGMNIKQYQWSTMSISGIPPISLADIGIDIELAEVYDIVCRHIEKVLTMTTDELQKAIQLYM